MRAMKVPAEYQDQDVTEPFIVIDILAQCSKMLLIYCGSLGEGNVV